MIVEYGADLHTAEHGSGIPTRCNTDDPADKVWYNIHVAMKKIVKFSHLLFFRLLCRALIGKISISLPKSFRQYFFCINSKIFIVLVPSEFQK